MNIKNENSVAKFNFESGKNGNAPTVKLNSGYEIPIVGIGTYSLTGTTCINAIKSALNQGYRLIDTASFILWQRKRSWQSNKGKRNSKGRNFCFNKDLSW